MTEENKNCPFFNECNHTDCDRFCMKHFKTNYYFTVGYVPEDRRNKFKMYVDKIPGENDEKAFTRLSEIEGNVEEFVSSGNNLYIYSQNAGNGKTSWSFRLLRSYVDKVWYKRDLYPIILFISVPKFLLELKANITTPSEYVQNILEAVRKADLVVWDDIGSKNGTEFEISNLLNLIDDRITNNKSNIYTSNLNRAELHNLLGDRLYSRVYNYSECIKLVGRDKRSLRNLESKGDEVL